MKLTAKLFADGFLPTDEQISDTVTSLRGINAELVLKSVTAYMIAGQGLRGMDSVTVRKAYANAFWIAGINIVGYEVES